MYMVTAFFIIVSRLCLLSDAQESSSQTYLPSVVNNAYLEDTLLEYTQEEQTELYDDRQTVPKEAEEPKPVQPPKVYRKTVFGTECDAPHTCFWGHDNQEYCRVNDVVVQCQPLKYPKNPGQSGVEFREPDVSAQIQTYKERYTVDGQKCEIPKKYNARTLLDCLRVSANQEICYADGKWQYCAPLGSDGLTPMYPQESTDQSDTTSNEYTSMAIQRYTTKGKLCVMPFMYNGQEQYDCVRMPDEKEWCLLQGSWEECADVSKLFNQQGFRGYDQYQQYGTDQAATQGNSKKSSNSVVVAILVILFVLLGAAAAAGGYLYFRRATRGKRHAKTDNNLIGGNIYEMGKRHKNFQSQ
eukprot:TRINITY_DN358_c0_g2_i1.p1 TRINITY_DN358_c0_g2~~TRINITY_DN358_c0_g2_i1.p1  ORF type:complete len:355 (+),score=20.81 TRINITY_DN358_c0_g2_i1:111-1175(+)